YRDKTLPGGLPSGAVLQTLLERLSKMHSAMKIAACDKAIDEHLRYGRCAMERLRGRWEGKWNQFPLPHEFFTLPNEHRSSPLTGSLFFRDYQIRKASVRTWHGVFRLSQAVLLSPP
ncbi:hypothetical protein, partial [Caballeronia sp.]|uniref:hypothetical protein n=1 Tax=Caballeronia sp. TaxID=1931223 RepID=UPI003C326371